MKKAIVALVIFGAGLSVGLLLREGPVAAQGGGAGNGNAATPTAACGDVDGDGQVILTDVLYLARWLFQSGEPPRCRTGPLPATGQEKCYDNTAELADCANPDFPGQDGFHQRGCPMQGRFVDNGDGTVSDTCTGLMWAKSTLDIDKDGDGNFDADDRLNWHDALQHCDRLVLCPDGTWSDEIAGCQDQAGNAVQPKHNDWRLPNVRELQSIIDYSRIDPVVHPRFDIPNSSAFDLPMAEHWTSTTFVHDPPDRPWMVSLRYGHAAYFFWNPNTGNLQSRPKTGRQYILPVRTDTGD